LGTATSRAVVVYGELLEIVKSQSSSGFPPGNRTAACDSPRDEWGTHRLAKMAVLRATWRFYWTKYTLRARALMTGPPL
jgi:hypothetical protein